MVVRGIFGHISWAPHEHGAFRRASEYLHEPTSESDSFSKMLVSTFVLLGITRPMCCNMSAPMCPHEQCYAIFSATYVSTFVLLGMSIFSATLNHHMHCFFVFRFSIRSLQMLLDSVLNYNLETSTDGTFDGALSGWQV